MILFSNNKSKLNLIIDIIMLLLLIPVSGIGLLMKYVLVPAQFLNSTFKNILPSDRTAAPRFFFDCHASSPHFYGLFLKIFWIIKTPMGWSTLYFKHFFSDYADFTYHITLESYYVCF